MTTAHRLLLCLLLGLTAGLADTATAMVMHGAHHRVSAGFVPTLAAGVPVALVLLLLWPVARLLAPSRPDHVERLLIASAAAVVTGVVVAGATGLAEAALAEMGTSPARALLTLMLAAAATAAALVWHSLPSRLTSPHGALTAAAVASLLAAVAVAMLQGIDTYGRTAAAVTLGTVSAIVVSVAVVRAAGRLPFAVKIAPALLIIAWGMTWAPHAVTPMHSRTGVAPPGRPDVILVTIDTLRADGIDAPGFAGLAAGATRFHRAYATAPWTLPSLASMMTGHHPEVHLARGAATALPLALPTLAEHLRDAGYATAAIVSSFMLADDRLGFPRGFDVYAVSPRPQVGGGLGVRLLRRLLPDEFWEARARHLVEKSIAWIGSHDPRQQLFLWLHLYDPHLPYDADENTPRGRPGTGGFAPRHMDDIRSGRLQFSPADRLRIRALYDAEVAQVDRAVGRLVQGLRELGRFESSLVIVTADHGEEFWDHGGFEHGHTLYDELVRVPLIVKRPHQTRGETIERAVSLVDLSPTVLELLGIATHQPSRPWLREDPPQAEAPVFFGSLSIGSPAAGVLTGGTKFIRWPAGMERLYAIDADPDELADVGATHVDTVERLRRLLARHEADATNARLRLGIRGPAEIDDLGPLRNRLRALGYVQP